MGSLVGVRKDAAVSSRILTWKIIILASTARSFVLVVTFSKVSMDFEDLLVREGGERNGR
jgi:hypothetical protein